MGSWQGNLSVVDVPVQTVLWPAVQATPSVVKSRLAQVEPSSLTVLDVTGLALGEWPTFAGTPSA